MQYNFDEIIDRKGTDAVKLEALKSRWGRTDLLPMWIADMDFRTPPFIVQTMKERLQNEIIGYTSIPDEWYNAIVRWQAKQHGWHITPEMLSFSPGIVPGLSMLVQSLTAPGDKILIQQPVYHPFIHIIESNKRTLVNSPLDWENGKFKMNMQRLKEDIKGCKFFFLCNPHNPGGKVWSREILEEIADICKENNTIVMSDEIHADLTLPPRQHTVFSTVSEAARMNNITFSSPSKVFNMAGVSSAYIIIENPEIRERFYSFIEGSMYADGNIFAFNTVVSAYEQGHEWQQQALQYIQENINFLDEYLKKHIPAIKAVMPEASYLVFLDCRELALEQEELMRLFVEDARLALNDGASFGKEGNGFMRMNIACPRSTLTQALEQLKTAVNQSIRKGI